MITEEVIAWLDYYLAFAVIGSLNVVEERCRCVRGAKEVNHTKLQVYRARAKPVKRKVGDGDAPIWFAVGIQGQAHVVRRKWSCPCSC